MESPKPNARPLEISSSNRDDSSQAREIQERLREHVEAAVGPSGREPLTVSAMDHTGALRAGLRGYSHWAWMYVSHLWVSESERGTGVGSQLLRGAVDEALRRNCVGLYVDTFDPGARDFYVKNGFKLFGELTDFPRGSTRFFLKRDLKL